MAIDFTKSNEWTGTHSFGGRCLHALDPAPPASRAYRPNPYERCIDVIARTLAPFDADQQIPLLAFGDAETRNAAVKLLGNAVCAGAADALARYRRWAPQLQLAGPTSFAPAIDEACRLVAAAGHRFHLLVIVADGQIDSERDRERTRQALARASHLPLSVVIVGVGDG